MKKLETECLPSESCEAGLTSYHRVRFIPVAPQGVLEAKAGPFTRTELCAHVGVGFALTETTVVELIRQLRFTGRLPG